MMLNLDRWKRGDLRPPEWCVFVGNVAARDYCWSWVCGLPVTAEDCRECEWFLGMGNPPNPP